ncbi:hypothetical protein [Nocardioides sp.]|uniref:hypothetical protein n=1 Tax=Nocardioides sp. TaxID=35761 RepID=UPI0031FEBCE1|nr:hypothetical protein [Nocardioides sp.]
MKKLIVGLFAALLMGTGLVAFTDGAAVAACPYTGCIDTSTDAGGQHVVRRGSRPSTIVRVFTAGNGQPKGTVFVTYERVKGGFSKTVTVGYHGHSVSFKGPVLTKTGKYKVVAHFSPKSGSPWSPSQDSYGLKVRR